MYTNAEFSALVLARVEIAHPAAVGGKVICRSLSKGFDHLIPMGSRFQMGSVCLYLEQGARVDLRSNKQSPRCLSQLEIFKDVLSALHARGELYVFRVLL